MVRLPRYYGLFLPKDSTFQKSFILKIIFIKSSDVSKTFQNFVFFPFSEPVITKIMLQNQVWTLKWMLRVT